MATGHRVGKQDSPLRHWLRVNLPAEPQPGIRPLTWTMLRQYADGGSTRQLADEHGLRPEAVSSRINRAARTLGYTHPDSQAWLLRDGRVAPHAARRDSQTGCLLWNGYLGPYENGPTAGRPQSHRADTSSEVGQPRFQVRRVLWEQRHGPVPSDLFIAAACGNRACVNPDHGEVRPRYGQLSDEQRESLVARKEEETRREAAARLGVTPETVSQVRGPGGKRPPLTSTLRTWLIEHMPQERPEGVLELDWAVAGRYARGVSLATIGAEHGVSRQMVHMRIRRAATSIGWSRS